MITAETLKDLDMVDLVELIGAKAEQEAEEFNHLSEAYNGLITQNHLLRDEIESLKRKVVAGANVEGSYQAKIDAKEAERLTLKGKLTAAENDLKQLKSLGDIKSVNRRLKEHKEKSAELQKALTKVKQERNQLIKDRVDLSKRLAYLEDFPAFKSTSGETVFLHGQKVLIEFQKGEQLCVVLKYWHPTGIGRLITYNGVQLNVSDGGLEGMENVAPVSDAVLDFCLGWFAENVDVRGKEQHFLGHLKKES